MTNDILEKFTTHLKSVLVRAYTLAHELAQEHITPEHLLWSLITEKGSLGSEMLQKLRLSPEGLRETIAEKPRSEKPEGVPKLTAATKRAIEKAVLTANIHDHKYVGTEHLLAGLLQLEDPALDALFDAHAIDRKQVRNQISLVLKSTSKFPDLAEGIQKGATPPASHLGERAKLPVREREDKKGSGKKKTPALDFFALDLTAPDSLARIDPVVGRDAEIERMIQILSRRTKNNPVLLGDPGVGKTAIVEGLARRIAETNVPKTLLHKRLLALDLPLLVAGTIYRGEFEGRLKQIIDEVKNNADIILFIDEIHTLAGAGSASGSMDAADILKPALARGEIHCIGATTLEEYKKHIEGDAALERRFQPIVVAEPSPEETLAILRGLRDRYAGFHSVTITDAALEAAVRFAGRYLTDRFFPDKAIDLLDESAAAVRVKTKLSQDEIHLLGVEGVLKDLRAAKQHAVTEEQFTDALTIKEKEREHAAVADGLRRKLAARPPAAATVTEKDVAVVVSRMTGVPTADLMKQERARLLNLEAELKERIVGQDEVIHGVAEYIRRASAGLTDPRRPLASFLFMGPSGVGKTELAKTLAHTVFGGESALIRLDMSEFSEPHTVSKLIGSPAGYVGYRDTTKLTDHIRRRPYSVVLFDEVEKAHPDVLNLLLQILEDGALTDAVGKKVSFKQAVIILTSNVGIERFLRGQMGFATSAPAELAKELTKEAETVFRPELVNRLDRIFVFRPLEVPDLERIAEQQLAILTKRLAENGTRLRISSVIARHLAKKSFVPEQGARAVRRTIQDVIEGPLAERLLAAEKTNRTIVLGLRNNELTMKT